MLLTKHIYWHSTICFVEVKFSRVFSGVLATMVFCCGVSFKVYGLLLLTLCQHANLLDLLVSGHM